MKLRIVIKYLLCGYILQSCVSTKVVDYVPIEDKNITSEDNKFYKISTDKGLLYVRVMKVDIITERVKSYITVKTKEEMIDDNNNLTVLSSNYGNILRIDNKKYQKEITSLNVRDTITIRSGNKKFLFVSN